MVQVLQSRIDASLMWVSDWEPQKSQRCWEPYAHRFSVPGTSQNKDAVCFGPCSLCLPVEVTELLSKELDKISGVVCELGSASMCARISEAAPQTAL